MTLISTAINSPPNWSHVVEVRITSFSFPTLRYRSLRRHLYTEVIREEFNPPSHASKPSLLRPPLSIDARALFVLFLPCLIRFLHILNSYGQFSSMTSRFTAMRFAHKHIFGCIQVHTHTNSRSLILSARRDASDERC